MNQMQGLTRILDPSIVEEAKARNPSAPRVTTPKTKTGQVTTTPATKTMPSTGTVSPSTTGSPSRSTATGDDYPASILDIQVPTVDKSVPTLTDYTLIVFG